MGKIISTFLVLFFISFAVYAADYTAVSNGNWDDSSTWDLLSVPASGDNALIPINNSDGGVTIGSGTNACVNSVRLTIKDGLLTMGGGNLVATNGVYTNFAGTQIIFSQSGVITGNIGTSGTKKIGHLLIQAGSTATVDGDISTQYIRITGNDPDQTFRLADGHTLTGNIYVGSSSGTFTGNHGIVEFLGSGTVVGYISVVAPGDKDWAGTVRHLILNSGNVTVTGDVRSQNYGLKSSTLAVTGNVIQGADGVISTQVRSAITYGRITATASATVPDTSTVSVDVLGYVPEGSILTIVDGSSGTGVSAGVPVITDSAVLSFASNSEDSADLTITSSRSGYNNFATNSNAATVGSALESIGAAGASGDMLTVLNTLDSMSTATEVSNALNALVPNLDNSIPQVSQSTLGNFLNTVMSRLGNLMLISGDNAGISTGNPPMNKNIWAQGFGSYLEQNPRGASNGYKATIWGTVVGVDKLIHDILRLGLSFGYAKDNISSKDNSAHTDVDSYQGTLYGSLLKENNYLNGALSFAYNQYDGARHIAFSDINRVANSDYDGQQYSVYLEGGHNFRRGKFELTPLVSIRYERLHLEDYTEENAGSLNFAVDSQNYDFLQSGLGAKISCFLEGRHGIFVPEFHIKWLYDFVGDKQQSIAAFTGGGGSFATSGFRPARSSCNLGTRLGFVTQSNIEIALNYDFQVKEDFHDHSGYVNVRYSF